jgi:hypothetical protein
MTSQNRLLVSEDINGEKWDRCLTDTIVKTGSKILFLFFSDYQHFSFGFGIGYCLFGYSFQT